MFSRASLLYDSSTFTCCMACQQSAELLQMLQSSTKYQSSHLQSAWPETYAINRCHGFRGFLYMFAGYFFTGQ